MPYHFLPKYEIIHIPIAMLWYVCIWVLAECDSFLVDRTPNILNKDQIADKKPKNDKSPISLKHEFDPTGEV